jgi:hypothetical protein
MKTGMKIFFAVVGVIALFLGLSLAFGWFDIYYTKTIGKEKQNVQREVFEQTQSYVEGKRQEALKYRLEYMSTTDTTEKRAIKAMISQSFANFDEEKLSPELRDFIYKMKYQDL